VERFLLPGCLHLSELTGESIPTGPALVMQAEQEDQAKDDGCENDLSDAVVEDPLVRVRGVAEVGFFVGRRFIGYDGTGAGRCVLLLLYVHFLDSLKLQQRSLSAAQISVCGGAKLFNGEFPCFQGQGCL